MYDRKYVFVYYDSVELCRTPEQAIMFVNSLFLYPKKIKPIRCNDFCEERIYALFYGDITYHENGLINYINLEGKIIPGFKVLRLPGMGTAYINFHTGLADTLEAHNKLYYENIENAKQARFQQNKDRISVLDDELSKPRQGLYAIELFFYITSCTIERGSVKGLSVFKGNIYAVSGYDAYNKTTEFLTVKYEHNAFVTHIDFPRPNSDLFKFVYMKVDV